MKKRIVFDCDCTMGVEGCDVDDGLALLYLLGCPEAELLGITASYGNSRMDVVWDTIGTVVRETGLTGIPVRRGAETAGCSGSRFPGRDGEPLSGGGISSCNRLPYKSDGSVEAGSRIF